MADLKPCNLAREYLKLHVLCHAAYYKPIKLHRFVNNDNFLHLQDENFCHLAEQYPLKDEHFQLDGLHPDPFDRFLQLLAPLTLFHFSNASKEIYYLCLDMRGLECSRISLNSEWGFMGILGRRGGYHLRVPDGPMDRYKIAYNTLRIDPREFLQHPHRFLFVKRYSILYAQPLDALFDDNLAAFCEAVFHPQIDYVFVSYGELYDPSVVGRISFFLDCCKDVKNVTIVTGALVKADAVFYQIKNAIEAWSVHTSRLEVFIINYRYNFFQLDGHRLVRCVRVGREWYWAADGEIVENTNYDKDYLEVGTMHLLPTPIMEEYYEDVLDALLVPEQIETWLGPHNRWQRGCTFEVPKEWTRKTKKRAVRRVASRLVQFIVRRICGGTIQAGL